MIGAVYALQRSGKHCKQHVTTATGTSIFSSGLIVFRLQKYDWGLRRVLEDHISRRDQMNESEDPFTSSLTAVDYNSESAQFLLRLLCTFDCSHEAIRSFVLSSLQADTALPNLLILFC